MLYLVINNFNKTINLNIDGVVAGLLLCLAASFENRAQFCDPGVAPSGLASEYTAGSGVLLQWDAVPGSAGVLLRVDLPSGTTINPQIVGSAAD
jgi:hypothetical protein